MRRVYGVLLVVLAVLVISGSGTGLAEPATPCAMHQVGQEETYAPGALVVFHGTGNAEEGLQLLAVPPTGFIQFQVTYSGHGYFAATLLAPDGTTFDLVTVNAPISRLSMITLSPGSAAIQVTADSDWAILVS